MKPPRVVTDEAAKQRCELAVALLNDHNKAIALTVFIVVALSSFLQPWECLGCINININVLVLHNAMSNFTFSKYVITPLPHLHLRNYAGIHVKTPSMYCVAMIYYFCSTYMFFSYVWATVAHTGGLHCYHTSASASFDANGSQPMHSGGCSVSRVLICTQSS